MSWGLQGKHKGGRQKEMSFLKVFAQNSFCSWYFLRGLNEERPQDETIVRCRAGLRELCGADCATQHGTGPLRRETLLCCTVLFLLLALLTVSCTSQVSTIRRATLCFLKNKIVTAVKCIILHQSGRQNLTHNFQGKGIT